ncbi:MAG: response regulator [Vicinamibacterales bacterium]
MRALLCDDDASVRLIAKRVLEDQFGCTVVECQDGVEALNALSDGSCAFAILDVDMPGMGGLETLEEIRASDVTCDLPVIILSAERDEETVIKLMQLGVSDYIVKPLRHANFVVKIEALLRTLPAEPRQVTVEPVQINPKRPALIVDGDPDFRALFAAQVQIYGDAVQADSGAAALMAFRKTPADVVFIGSGLGVMSADRVAAKIREARPWGVRLVRVIDEAGQPAGEQFDGVIVRSTSPDIVKEELKPFLAVGS